MKHDPDSLIQQLTLTTGDGEQLEAEMFVPSDARLGIVIAHPHPLHGGDMHSPVTTAIWQALADLGAAGIRFNFRGVGSSSGQHDDGNAEQLDVMAAAGALHAALSAGAPVALAGWSFGADVSLAIAEVDGNDIAGWFLVAPPLRLLDQSDWADAAASPQPKHLACPAHDQFRPPDAAAEVVATWTATEVHPVEGADHFLVGRAHLVIEQLGDFIARL